MASRAVLTLSEVLQEVENYDYDGEMSEGSEDDFEGYIDEGGAETSVGEQLGDNVTEELGEEDEEQTNNDMDTSVPPIPDYTLTPGCSMPLSGNSPIDYFTMFVDDTMLHHIVEQTKLNYEQFSASHTLGPRSRIRQWAKQEHTISELRQFLALVLVMGIVRYPSIESHWSTSWPIASDAFHSVSCTRSTWSLRSGRGSMYHTFVKLIYPLILCR